jgi:hypothetical protein
MIGNNAQVLVEFIAVVGMQYDNIILLVIVEKVRTPMNKQGSWVTFYLYGSGKAFQNYFLRAFRMQLSVHSEDLHQHFPIIHCV